MMKKTIVMVALVAASVATFAAEVTIGRVSNGSGTPGNVGVENAKEVYNDVLHAPQYMVGFPTSATIWPRVIDIPCTKTDNILKCDGYKWTPSMGRGEYLFVTPKVVEVTEPQVKVYTEVKEVKVPVYIEVEKKKLRE